MNRFYYLLHLQYLGFRYHGFQKQLDVKTVQHMLDRTLITVLKTEEFKTLGASRTDSMVSSLHHITQLATVNELPPNFLQELNYNLPQDIRALKVESVEKSFNPISSRKMKEYHYYFSHGQKSHPFCAPFMTNLIDDLDIELMQKGAKLFEGEHNFIQYCYRGNENKQYIRQVFTSQIELNSEFSASFFPDISYRYLIRGEGFMRNQIRLMMGTLFKLGLHKLTLHQIQQSLLPGNDSLEPIGFIAPASGLMLADNQFIE